MIFKIGDQVCLRSLEEAAHKHGHFGHVIAFATDGIVVKFNYMPEHMTFHASYLMKFSDGTQMEDTREYLEAVTQ